MRASSEAGYLETNLAIIKDLAATKRNERSLDPPRQAHGSDRARGWPKSSSRARKQLQDLERLVQMLEEGNECKTNEASFFAGIELGGPEGHPAQDDARHRRPRPHRRGARRGGRRRASTRSAPSSIS
jgi:hypothetical protein